MFFGFAPGVISYFKGLTKWAAGTKQWWPMMTTADMFEKGNKLSPYFQLCFPAELQLSIAWSNRFVEIGHCHFVNVASQFSVFLTPGSRTRTPFVACVSFQFPIISWITISCGKRRLRLHVPVQCEFSHLNRDASEKQLPLLCPVLIASQSCKIWLRSKFDPVEPSTRTWAQ